MSAKSDITLDREDADATDKEAVLATLAQTRDDIRRRYEEGTLADR